ncbi:DMT family transporter [Thalassobaculum sp.]|uniref:DMT family transporter n=1 Tax=Thalassobaculum sp. TaxID=2022740 RepID=UPI0032EBF5D9
MASETAAAAPQRSSPLIAVGLMLAACACIAATTLMGKALGRGIGGEALHPLQISAGRFAFALLTLTPILAWFRPSLRGAAWPVHIGRTVCGWGAVTTMFAAAAAMRLADATAISFLSPMVAMVLAIPLLGEKVGPWRWGAAAIALTGALVLIRPGAEAFQPVALVALASACFMGVETILVKRLTGGANRAGEPMLRILAINNTLGAAIAITAASFVWIWPSPAQWALLAAIGTVMVTAQSMFILALRRGDASFVVPLFYATLVFAALYDFAVFGEVPTVVSASGAALIITGAVVLAWRERVRGQSAS